MTKDERIAELESEVAEYKQQCYDCKHLHKKLELNIKNKLIGDVENLKADLKSQKLLTEIYMAISGTRAEKKDYEKVIRHEICEKIRRKMTVYRYVEVKTKKGYEWALTDSDINEILNEIEQGEEE